MANWLTHMVAFLLGTGITAAAIIAVILKNPEKVEKWLALLMKLALQLKIAVGVAHKKYVQYDLQGHVNEFIKHHAQEMPGFQVSGVKLEWESQDVKRDAFLKEDKVVVRVRRDDPHHENFTKAVYLFVSTSLLYRAKRYISPSQGRAIDLYVTTEVFKEQKPEVVDHFVEAYLHRHLDDDSKVEAYFGDFDLISRAGLFFPVFLQEMDYLGQKVFGSRRGSNIVTEVDSLVEFLRNFALRPVGQDSDLEFTERYCRFAVVIVGRASKIAREATLPYVNFVRRLDNNIETVYLVGRATNSEHIRSVCEKVSDRFDTVSEKKLKNVVLHGDEEKKCEIFIATLRSVQRSVYATAS